MPQDIELPDCPDKAKRVRKIPVEKTYWVGKLKGTRKRDKPNIYQDISGELDMSIDKATDNSWDGEPRPLMITFTDDIKENTKGLKTGLDTYIRNKFRPNNRNYQSLDLNNTNSSTEEPIRRNDNKVKDKTAQNRKIMQNAYKTVSTGFIKPIKTSSKIPPATTVADMTDEEAQKLLDQLKHDITPKAWK